VRVVRRGVVVRPAAVPVLRRVVVGAGTSPVAAVGVAARRVRVAGRGVSLLVLAGPALLAVGAGALLAGAGLTGGALVGAGLLFAVVAVRRRGATTPGSGGAASLGAGSTGTRNS